MAEALVLTMRDTLLLEPLAAERLVRTRPRVLELLALTLGDVGDEDARELLEALLADSRPEVRAAAALGLGQLGDARAAPALAAAVLDRDDETGRLAIEALARLDEPFVNWSGALGGLSPEQLRRRFGPALFRLGPTVVARLASDAMVDDPWLLYAHARTAAPGGAPLVRRFLGHPDPWVRGWSARGLAALGDGSDLERLRPLLDDEATSPVVQALRAAAALVVDGRAAAPRGWIPVLRRLLEDRRPAVRLTVFEVAGHWLRDEELERDLRRLYVDGSTREQELVVLALARGGGRGAVDAALEAARATEVSLRVAAATAAGQLRAAYLLERLWLDPAPPVRLAVLAAELAELSGEGAALVARRALRDEDPAVRAAALEWLAESPVLPLDELLAAVSRDEVGRIPELGINGARAVAARSRERLERGACIAALERMTFSREYLVRREAAAALAQLGREPPRIGGVATGRNFQLYRDVAARVAASRQVELETERGSLLLELQCEDTPLTCDSFLQLVAQGFYDGLRFHRVVPDFVIQGGDPRADGWGGPGFTLRDESSRLRFERGVVGLAKSGPDTAGSQFFITLSRQPHLDGAFTAFARVVSGDEVLDEILQGDHIVRMAEVAATSLPP